MGTYDYNLLYYTDMIWLYLCIHAGYCHSFCDEITVTSLSWVVCGKSYPRSLGGRFPRKGWGSWQNSLHSYVEVGSLQHLYLITQVLLPGAMLPTKSWHIERNKALFSWEVWRSLIATMTLEQSDAVGDFFVLPGSTVRMFTSSPDPRKRFHQICSQDSVHL